MKEYIFTALLLVGVVYAQKMKYVVAYCTLQGVNGVKDTVFNSKERGIIALVDLDAKTESFDWKMPDYNVVKRYNIVQSNIEKEDTYTTMGIYSIRLKCKIKTGKIVLLR